MTEKDKVRLIHILDAIEAIKKAIGDKTFEEYFDDFVLVAAVERFFITIGEAIGQLSDEVKNSFEDSQKVKDFRNLIVHEYFNINPIEIWKVTESDLDELKQWVQNQMK